MFKGIITPIMTPFCRDKDQSINYEATKKLIDYVIENGVSGIFVLGSNGEFPVISFEEKLEFTKKVVEFVNHRVPVYAGPGSCSTQETIKLAQEMEKLGVNALSVISPYFVTLSEQELVTHFKMVAESVSIPVILYNIPRLTGNSITKFVFEQVASLSNIAGIKDSSRDLDNLKGYLEVAKKYGLSVLIGSDGIIAQGYRMGADGAIAGMSNVIPKIMTEMFAALERHDDEKANELQEKVNYIRSVNKKATMPVVLKRSLELANIAEAGPSRLPVSECSSELDEEIVEMLRYYKLI